MTDKYDNKDNIEEEGNKKNRDDAAQPERRQFLGAAGGVTAAMMMSGAMGQNSNADNVNEKQLSIDDFPTRTQDESYEVLVIGSGFGGAVTACRTSKRWPGKVLMVERGKRYGRGDFPRSFDELSNAFWRIPGDNVPRVFPLWGEQRGIFDLRSYDHMDTLVAAGYGGGSLIYGVGIIEPVSDSFDDTWPESIKREALKPYFDVFRKAMGAQSLPDTDEPARQLNRKALYEAIADNANKERVDVEVAIFFGNDPENPTPAGTTEKNRYGAEQTSCTYCAECIVGCNFQAKNTLDLNYLYVAENNYGMSVRTEHQAEKIVPLDSNGLENIFADGRYGYHVYLLDLENKETVKVKTQRVVLAAGTYGSNEVLFKNKYQYFSLPRISNQLGNNYSGNGDFITVSLGSEIVTDSGKGPTIIQYIDHTTGVADKSEQFIAEDMSIPLSLFGSLVDILSPNYFLRPQFDQMLSVNDINAELLIQVHVGLDKSSGNFSLNWFNGALQLNWPYYENVDLYNNIIGATYDAGEAMDADLSFAFPTWNWPLRRNLTVHPLGGCTMADTIYDGVVSAKRGELGQVFNYQNLYVADGSIVPTSLGANPALVIGAMAEMIAEDITGIMPTDDLT